MNQLFILAFDHRKSLLKNFDHPEIPELKKVIYEGFKLAIGGGGVPKDEAAILVDEEFGTDILLDAKSRGYQICLPVEKSGVNDFEFAYGSDWQKHIKKFNPHFVKALVRSTNNLQDLKNLSDFCQHEDYKFILEVLADDLLTIIQRIYENGIKPDLWKLKGSTELNSVREVVRTIRANGRKHVGMLILGRGEDQDTLDKWLRIGREVGGVVGFAIGRTIFMPPLLEIKDGKIDRKRAAEKIAKNYQHFYDVFNA